MADPYLQIRGLAERGAHPDPETRGGSLKKNFSALRASISSKNKGGGGGGGGGGGAFSSQSVYCYALRPRSHERLIAQ